MSVRPSVNLLYMPGTNCQRETATAFRRVGAEPEYVFLADLVSRRATLADADIVCIPGGFSFGDHTGAGNIAAWYLKTALADQLDASRSKPMLCVCNGFQIAARAGLFGAVSLTLNANGTFRDEPRQPHIVAEDNDSLWLHGLQGATLRFPCAHGEGRFVHRGTEGWQTAFSYPTDHNPDGSTDGIAGVTSADGMVLGMMNHPERAAAFSDDVLELFANAVRFVRS